MEKMRMESVDRTAKNMEAIGALFPNCITETTDENGRAKKAINFDLLRQMLSGDLVEGDEAYEFTWVGKKAAIMEGNRPIRKTLRPCVEESRNWDITENLYIEGDNLDVLKLLQESYLSKIKMIYIDPPYNTGNDFLYRDDFKLSKEEYAERNGEYNDVGERLFKNTDTNGRFHSDWCSMIYPRLMLARNLLTEDGVIVISIDDNEIENMRRICNEIFGEDNLVTCFIWNCSTAGGIRPKFASKTHEYVLCYAKNKEALPTIYAPLSEGAKRMYTQRDERGIYRDKDFLFKNKSTNVNQKYLITCPDGERVRPKEGYIYRFIRERFEEAQAEGLVTFKQSSTGPLVNENGEQAHWNIYIKKYLGDAMGAPSTLIPKEMISIYNVGTQCVQNLFDGVRVFENVKPVDLIEYFINMFSDENAIVMDFFSGSATTAHAVMELNAKEQKNRKFIMVQLPEACEESSAAYKAGFGNICDVGKERIRRAAAQIADENGISVGDFDSGFRCLKLAESNMNDVYYAADEYSQDLLSMLETNIKEDRSDLDLLYGCLLEWGIPLSLRYRTVETDGKAIQIYNEGDLVACFDCNITENVVKSMAKMQPQRAVFRDAGFRCSAEKINAEELFKLYSPKTVVKVL